MTMTLSPALEKLDYSSWEQLIDQNIGEATEPMSELLKLERDFLKLNMNSNKDFAEAESFISFAESLVKRVKDHAEGIGVQGKYPFLNNIVKMWSPISRNPTGGKVFRDFESMLTKVKREVERQRDPHAKMRKNLLKAIREHQGELNDITAPLEIALQPHPKKDLAFSFDMTSAKGKRRDMEDSEVYQEIEEGLVWGVFDGHADKQLISKEVAQIFPGIFSTKLKAYDLNVLKGFEEACYEVQTVLRSNPIGGGSTAVVCFIPKDDSNTVYTMTLGDSEAKLFRNHKGNFYAIPLSVCRDYSSENDEIRVSNLISAARSQKRRDEEGNVYEVPVGHIFEVQGEKKRFGEPFPKQSTNVSRAFGDFNFEGIINQKCKVTECAITEGDTIFVGCDGVWNFIKNSQVVDKVILAHNSQFAKKSDRLVHEALQTSDDNVTGIVIEIRPKMQDKQEKQDKPPVQPIEKTFLQKATEYFWKAWDFLINFLSFWKWFK